MGPTKKKSYSEETSCWLHHFLLSRCWRDFRVRALMGVTLHVNNIIIIWCDDFHFNNLNKFEFSSPNGCRVFNQQHRCARAPLQASSLYSSDSNANLMYKSLSMLSCLLLWREKRNIFSKIVFPIRFRFLSYHSVFAGWATWAHLCDGIMIIIVVVGKLHFF